MCCLPRKRDGRQRRRFVTARTVCAPLFCGTATAPKVGAAAGRLEIALRRSILAPALSCGFALFAHFARELSLKFRITRVRDPRAPSSPKGSLGALDIRREPCEKPVYTGFSPLSPSSRVRGPLPLRGRGVSPFGGDSPYAAKPMNPKTLRAGFWRKRRIFEGCRKGRFLGVNPEGGHFGRWRGPFGHPWGTPQSEPEYP